MDLQQPRDVAEGRERAMADRLRVALEMQQFGLRMKRAALAREHPNEGPELVAERLRRWLVEAPFHEAPGFERSRRTFEPT